MTQPRRWTAKECLAFYQARADGAFRGHVIRERDRRSWLCFAPYTNEKGGWRSMYWFEVVVLAGGELYVHGDISGVHFAHYGKHETPEEVLRWMGGHESVDGYVREKASIGMQLPSGERQALEVVDEGVWLDEALSHIEEVFLDGAKGLFDQETVNLEPYSDAIPSGSTTWSTECWMATTSVRS